MAQILGVEIIINNPDTKIYTTEPSDIARKRLTLIKYADTYSLKVMYNNMPPSSIPKAFEEYDFEGDIENDQSQTIL